MEKEMWQKLEEYLHANYVESPVVSSQQSVKCDESSDKPTESVFLQQSDIYEQLERNLPPLEDTFRDQLLKLIRASGKTEAEVYNKAHIDRRLFSKIRTNKDYTPSKATILALILALDLEEKEAKDLLERAGYSFSKAQKGDIIILFFIRNRVYDIYVINDALEHFGIKMPWGF